MRWPAAVRTLAARLTGGMGSGNRAQLLSAGQPSWPTPALNTAPMSNAAGSTGSPQDAQPFRVLAEIPARPCKLTAREEAIAQAARTRRHDHQSKARAATLACLRRN